MIILGNKTPLVPDNTIALNNFVFANLSASKQ